MLYIVAIVIKRNKFCVGGKNLLPVHVPEMRPVAKKCGLNVLHLISLCELLRSYPECSLLHVPVKVH